MSFLRDTKTAAEDYDLILTGDLGFSGSELLIEIMKKEGVTLRNHNDCGMMIYYNEKQDTHAGGSGCGCSAAVLCAHILPEMEKGSLNKVLFIGTGALMSPTSVQQGESIPGIAHAVAICNQR